MPLAIELAAARVNVLSVKALAEKVDDRFRLLTAGVRTALPRQQTMRATIDWSYDLLAVREQRVFERLSIFAGGCTLATATTVCAGKEIVGTETISLLVSLVDKSLVVVDPQGSNRRYRLLESFRQYAYEKLAIRSECNVVAHAHALASLELAERFDRAFDFEPDEIWRELAQNEMDNWRAALHWGLVGRHDVLLGQRLAGLLVGVWTRFPLEGRRWITSALELVDERTPATATAALSYAECIVAWSLREYKVQLSCSETAIRRYDIVGDSLGIARAQSIAGHALLYLGRVAEAKIRLQEALLIARQLGQQRLLAYLLRCLGMASSLDGDAVAARRHMREALRIYEALAAKLGVANIMLDLSEVEFHAGNVDLALRDATNALAALRTFNDTRHAGAHINVAKYLFSLARYDEAKGYAVEALELAHERQLAAIAAWSLQLLATIATLRPHVGAQRNPKTHAKAARIFGFVDAVLTLGSGSGIEQPEYDWVVAVLREALGTDTVETLMAAGALMTEEQAVGEALSVRA